MILHQVSNSFGNYNYNSHIYCNASFTEHFHRNYELIYVFEGQTKLTTNGIESTLFPGEMILLPPYTIHALQIQDAKTWIGVFSEDHIISYAKQHQYVRCSKFTCSKDAEEFLKTHLFFEGIPDHFMRISALYLVCNECTKYASPRDGEQNHKFISEVVNYISNHLEQTISLLELSTAMNYEYHYFSSLFHQYFSMNFKQFINLFRFEKACSLLIESEHSAAFIAEHCGFGSIRNFNRVFKKLSGCSPQAYQKQHINEKKA